MSTFRQLRDEADLTVFGLASLAQVSISTINRMESGSKGVTKRLANQVLQALSERLGRKITIDEVENLNIVSTLSK